MNLPLNQPPAGEMKMSTLLFEPGTVIGGLEVTKEGPFLQVHKPTVPEEGAPVELTIYLCPPDPNGTDSWLAPRGHLMGSSKFLGKIEGPNGTHAVILKQR